MRRIESLETRRLFAATASIEPALMSWGWVDSVVVDLNDASDVDITFNDGRITVSSGGQIILDEPPLFGEPETRFVYVEANNGGDTIRLFSDTEVEFNILGGTGADSIHVEGTEGAAPSGTVHGNNGTDVFSLVNVDATTVYGDNGDDVCTFVNATNCFFDGGRGDDSELLA